MTPGEPANQASLFDSPAEQPPAYDAAFRMGRVEVSSKPAREILMRATGFMDQYDFTLNPYSGCAFGCRCFCGKSLCYLVECCDGGRPCW